MNGTYRPSSSIVVAAYNAEASIADCVRSLLELRYPRDLFEIIVVDNGSRDGTAAILASFGGAITVIEEPLRGRAAARNAGIRYARGEVIAFTDTDCTVDPDWLAALVAPLVDPCVGVAGGRILARRPANEIELFGEVIHDHRQAILAMRPPYAITMNWASRRSVLTDLGLFDLALRRGSDGDLAYRIGQGGYSFAYCPTAIIYHRNESSLAGLFREGFQHGFYAVPVRKRYARFIADWRAQHADSAPPADRKAGSSPRLETTHRRCQRAFRSGRRLGRAMGRLRFAILPLREQHSSGVAPASSRQDARSSPQESGSASVLLLQRFVVKTARGPLRPLWRFLHHAVIRAVAGAMRWRRTDRAVYVKGSFASGDPVYGISDIDMIVVTADHATSPGENRRLARERWERLCRAFPPLRSLMQHFWIYEQAELRAATSATCLTYGIEQAGASPGSPTAAYLGSRPLADEMALLAHPPLAPTMQAWRLLAGRDRRGSETHLEEQQRRITTWLDLQFLWRLGYGACLEPNQPHVPLLCVKFVADPVRFWLWLTRGEYVASREAALQLGFQALPEEEHALRRALELHRSLDQAPDPPLAEFLPFLLRFTSRIAHRITTDLEEESGTEVRLHRGRETDLSLPAGATDRLRQLFPGEEGPELIPLVDWRAVAIPPLPDETFSLVPGDPGDLTSIARAARKMDAGRYAALRSNGVLLLPARVRALLRTVQCSMTDPVSFALIDGRSTARFPDVPGWSARDWARRAVAEHRAWLADHRTQPIPSDESSTDIEDLARLLTAARAALFLESVSEGDPELALPLSAVAEQLAARDGNAGAVATEAVEAYRISRGDGGSPVCSLAALSAVVQSLPSYES